MSASGLGFAMVEEAVAPATPARGCGFDRILKAQIKGRLLLSEEEKATLAEIAHRLGRKALEEVAATAKPDTILGWYQKLIAKKFDGSRFRQRVGRPRVAEEIERLVLRMANENPAGATIGSSVP